jgi:electron transfer flavoprotein alpha subunit
VLNPGGDDVATVAAEIWLIGDGVANSLAPSGVARAVELGPFAPSSWAHWLASELGERDVVFSAEPDGRDLAARVAAHRGDDLFAGCVDVRDDACVLPRYGGATTEIVSRSGRAVITVQPRSRSHSASAHSVAVEMVALDRSNDVEVIDVEEPTGAVADLADASRIVAGGAGLADASDFAVLASVAEELHAAVGATRVVTDRGWVPEDRQIGTTGVSVSPTLYLAFGISGAVQHTAGLGSPTHLISVNTDPASPLSQMADLAIVSDAHATLAALAAELVS